MQYFVPCTACIHVSWCRVSVVVIMEKGGPACGCDPCDARRRVHAAVMEARQVPQEAVRHLFSQEVLRQVMMRVTFSHAGQITDPHLVIIRRFWKICAV